MHESVKLGVEDSCRIKEGVWRNVSTATWSPGSRTTNEIAETTGVWWRHRHVTWHAVSRDLTSCSAECYSDCYRGADWEL